MNEQTKQVIGKRIIAALAARDIKQKELAASIGVKDNVISFFCTGARVPNTEQVISIAKALNVSADYLLGLTENMTADKDLDAICCYTGLGEAAIKELHQYSEDEITYPHKLIDLLAESKSPSSIMLYRYLVLYLTSADTRLFHSNDEFNVFSDTLNDDVLNLEPIKEIISVHVNKRNPSIGVQAVTPGFLQSLYLLSILEELAQLKKDLNDRK